MLQTHHDAEQNVFWVANRRNYHPQNWAAACWGISLTHNFCTIRPKQWDPWFSWTPWHSCGCIPPQKHHHMAIEFSRPGWSFRLLNDHYMKKRIHKSQFWSFDHPLNCFLTVTSPVHQQTMTPGDPRAAEPPRASCGRSTTRHPAVLRSSPWPRRRAPPGLQGAAGAETRGRVATRGNASKREVWCWSIFVIMVMINTVLLCITMIHLLNSMKFHNDKWSRLMEHTIDHHGYLQIY